MELNSKQEEIYEKALEGHNLLILGQCGTGKSFLIRHIAKKLKEQGKHVQLTASTGISAVNIGGKTVHSWSGIGDGRYTNGELLEKLLNDENFQCQRDNIVNTNCLILDEISMLSSKTFNQLEYICRNVHNNDFAFGRIQVLAVGDFFQLPPVPDCLKNDPGDFCFKDPSFQKIFNHKVILQDVVRQKQPDLVKAINDVSRGELPKETFDLLVRLKRPLPPGPDPIRLHARNFDCLIFNAFKLMHWPGDEKVYNAIDVGDTSKLEKLSVPKQLHLKVGCPVMLLKNLSDKLVNGLRGVVISLASDEICVKFSCVELKDMIVNINQKSFVVYNSYAKQVVASRLQYPLCLAYSITIHKSQGLTLERVEVDATNIFSPGQLGVGIGRVTEKKGLRIIGFNQSAIIKHKPLLYEFYEQCDAGSFDDTGQLNCCLLQVTAESNNCGQNCNILSLEDEEISDFSENEVIEIDELLEIESENSESNILSNNENDLGNEIDCTNILALFAHANGEFPNYENILNFFDTNKKNLKIFVEKLYTKLRCIYEVCCQASTEKSLDSKIWTKFHSEVYLFSISKEYAELVEVLFMKQVSSNEFTICSRIFDKVCSVVIEKHKNIVPACPSNVSTCDISDSGKGKLRYVFGRCFAKSRYHFMKQAMNNLYKPKKQDVVSKQFLKVKLLDSLTKNYSELCHNSRYKETLYQTQRKQNLNQSLTNVSDEAFEFIVKLNKKRLELQNEENFNLFGAEILETVRKNLLSDQTLLKDWSSLFESFEIAENDCNNSFNKESILFLINELFLDILNRFCRIADNEFRKQLLRNLGKKKTERLRKKVLLQNQKLNITMKEISVDSSENKTSSHLRLKSVIFDHGKETFDNFIKADLLKLCSAYDIPTSSRATNDELKNTLCSVIIAAEKMTMPSVLSESSPAVCSISSKRKKQTTLTSGKKRK